MQRVSKGFFLGSIGGGLGVNLSLSFLRSFRDVSFDPKISLLLLLPTFYAVIVWFVLDYKMWAVIQGDQARMTPRNAVVFQLIPLFNLYWIFHVQWGFAKDYNDFVQIHGFNAPKLPPKLFLLFCILLFTIWIPVVGTVIALFHYFISLIIIWKVCDAINAIPQEETSNQ